MAPELRNRASERVSYLMESLNDGSSWRRRDWYAEGFIREDRRSLIGLPTVGIDGFIEQLRAWFEIGATAPHFSMARVVATSGESLAIVVLRFDFGSSAVEMLAVYRFDPAVQLLERLVSFDLDDVAAAHAELHQLEVEEGANDT